MLLWFQLLLIDTWGKYIWTNVSLISMLKLHFKNRTRTILKTSS